MTDSTASIPAQTCQELGIAVVPCPIQFGSETFLDGVDPVSEFYRRLESAEAVPTTSTPSPGSFLETYKRLAGEADEIISIHVMGTKSSIVESARLAASMSPEVPVHVVDSRTTTVGLGLLAMGAARLARTGQTAADILATLGRWIPSVHAHAGIPNLTQLRRSGRVSLGAALLGNLLSVKPLLYIGNGLVEVVDKARGWPALVGRLVEMAKEKAGDAKVILAVAHTNAEDEARRLLERVRDQFNAVETMVVEAGPTLATHAGPGAVAIITLAVE